MRLLLKMDLDNTAFDGETEMVRDGTEVARILRELARDLHGTYMPWQREAIILRDYNGNRVGSVVVKD